MVEYESGLDGVFAALADPTRRRILEMLGRGEHCVGEISRGCPMTLAGVSKHLQVLERAGLVVRRRQGRTHFLRTRRGGAVVAQEWLARYAQGWSDGFDALGRYLDERHGDARAGDPGADGPSGTGGTSE